MGLKTKETDFEPEKKIGFCPKCNQAGEYEENDCDNEVFSCKNCNIEWVEYWRCEHEGYDIIKRNGKRV